MIAIIVAFIYRWIDKRAALLEQDCAIVVKLTVELDRLAETTATKSDLKELKKLLSLLKQAELRFPKIPFGTIVATIEMYEKTVISEESAKRLKRVLSNKKLVDEALKRSREQGVKIADIRAAIETVQSIINRKLKR
ncbi:hypothetical protein ACWGIA_39310 [Streptomyces bobili]